MSAQNNGGAAFPLAFDDAPGKDVYAQNGMTLRDYFAAKAMQAVMICDPLERKDPPMIARDAYEVADAMLAERAK